MSGMKISCLQLTNFKRFTDLTLADIPQRARLVLLIGSNGSGKSCIFDAFSLLNRRPYKGIQGELPDYHRKNSSLNFGIKLWLDNGNLITRVGDQMPTDPPPKLFYGRSSNRIPARIEQVTDVDVTIRNDKDAPSCLIEDDRRVFADVLAFTSAIDSALRKPTFEGKQADTVAIFQKHIAPLNESLARIFGDNPALSIQLHSYDNSDSGKPVQLLFTKGSSKISFDLLSHGEKQIVVLLLGFITRQSLYQETIFYIDEMDVHLNTTLQKEVLKEIVEKWIPSGSQLWTASHSLGFIDYAQEAEEAVCVDLDQLDYDVPQVVYPVQKDRMQVFEIAVPKDTLGRLFANRKLIVCEGDDHKLYNAALDTADFLFLPAQNAASVFQMILADKTLWGLRDRDFLMESEVSELTQSYPNLRLLPYYSIENLLYHPENIASLCLPNFSATDWAHEILRIRPAPETLEIKHARSHIHEFKHLPLSRNRPMEANLNELYDAYRSSDFETVYRVLPMKQFSKAFLAPWQLTQSTLARAPWFKQRLHELFV
jgi:predicted ATPase